MPEMWKNHKRIISLNIQGGETLSLLKSKIFNYIYKIPVFYCGRKSENRKNV